MKLRQVSPTTAVAAAQIIGMSKNRVTVRTETGQVLRLPLAKHYQHDQIFLAALRDILKNKIWIPVNTRLHQLFQTDWLMEPVTSDD